MLFVWLALAFFLLAFVAATVFLALRGLELYRAFRDAGGEIGQALEGVERAADRSAELAERLGARADLAASLVRLHASRTRLAVLQAAWADALTPVGRARAYVARTK